MKFIRFSLDSDQLCSTWRGKAKDLGRNVCIVTSSKYTYLLFADGVLVDEFKFGEPFYPFSANPKKKPSLFQRKKIQYAEVVCLTSGDLFDLNWATSYIHTDSKTSQSYQITMYGTLYVEIERSRDDALNFYYNVGCAGPDVISKEYLKDHLLQPAIASVAPKVLERFLEENDIPAEECSMLSPVKQLELSEQVYENLRSVLGRFGLSPSYVCRNSAVSGIFVKK